MHLLALREEIEEHVFMKEKREKGRSLRGIVVSNRMKDTVIVRVSRYVKHPMYGKYQRLTKRYKVHNPGNTVQIGDAVTILSCRPVSKEKAFVVSSSV